MLNKSFNKINILRLDIYYLGLDLSFLYMAHDNIFQQNLG
jgi:hypothetical protein